MPLRDHFHPPLSTRHRWDKLHAGWPMVMVQHLAPKLPPRYEVGPGVHIGDRSGYEVDLATTERDEPDAGVQPDDGGGVATLAWAPPLPTITIDADTLDQDAYDVRVYDAELDQQLVAAVEIVSPGNKDRPEPRRMFVDKWAGLLSQGVCVSVVDVVTSRLANLYAELLASLDRTDPTLIGEPPPIYAVTMRRRERGRRRPVLDTWFHTLTVGQPLPTLHLWLSDTSGVTLDLEGTYEDTCRPLNIR